MPRCPGVLVPAADGRSGRYPWVPRPGLGVAGLLAAADPAQPETGQQGDHQPTHEQGQAEVAGPVGGHGFVGQRRRFRRCRRLGSRRKADGDRVAGRPGPGRRDDRRTPSVGRPGLARAAPIRPGSAPVRPGNAPIRPGTASPGFCGRRTGASGRARTRGHRSGASGRTGASGGLLLSLGAGAGGGAATRSGTARAVEQPGGQGGAAPEEQADQGDGDRHRHPRPGPGPQAALGGWRRGGGRGCRGRWDGGGGCGLGVVPVLVDGGHQGRVRLIGRGRHPAGAGVTGPV